MSTEIIWSLYSGTFNAGRNAEKRAARKREKLLRQNDVGLSGPGDRAPKRTKSSLTVDMLADRRLRQRRQINPL